MFHQNKIHKIKYKRKLLITLENPSRDMTTEAASTGFYHSPDWNKDFPRIQILTIEELLHNAEVKMPPQFGTFKHSEYNSPMQNSIS